MIAPAARPTHAHGMPRSTELGRATLKVEKLCRGVLRIDDEAKKRLCHILQVDLIDPFDVAMTVLVMHLKPGAYW